MMQITAANLKTAADLAARIEYLKSVKTTVVDQNMLIRACPEIEITVPVSAQPARDEVDLRIASATTQLTALGFDLLPG